jgi:hypothetical protein
MKGRLASTARRAVPPQGRISLPPAGYVPTGMHFAEQGMPGGWRVPGTLTVMTLALARAPLAGAIPGPAHAAAGHTHGA